MKAIKMKGGQAYVDEIKCVLCGMCIKECPQKAKTYIKSYEQLRELLAGGQPVAVSLAPSFAAVYPDWQRDRIPSALRSMGISHVSETSCGAWYAAKRAKEVIEKNPGRSFITSSCPAVVNYVEKYKGGKIDLLLPVLSPLAAHSVLLKRKLGFETKIAFIGPCVAKKGEILRDDIRPLIDTAITFEEMNAWFEDEGIDLKNFEASGFDMYPPKGYSPLFPVPGGFARTAGFEDDSMIEIINADGFEEIEEAVDFSADSDKPVLIDALLCEGGCINGPGISAVDNYLSKKLSLREYFKKEKFSEPEINMPVLSANFYDKSLKNGNYSDNEIIHILEKTGKSSPEDRLNCGACGYDSCEEKAAAVLDGMAETEMCIPFMRRLAEQRTDKIIESSPNGIVILDESLSIIHMNPAFMKFFMCGESIRGKKISYLMDPEPFVKLAGDDEDLVEMVVKHDNYGLVCHEILYPLRDDRQYVGIFVNITRSINNTEKLNKMKEETIRQADELLKHQISMAQNVARLLGESTARGEQLVDKLRQLTRDENASKSNENETLWDIYTSK